MALEKSEAFILKIFNWSESSRTVVFFARDFGRIALVDKGGRSLKSRRGRLMPFARMEITFYHSEKEARGYISEAELIEPFSFDRDGTLGRLAYASAACELLNLLLPEEEPQAGLYSYALSFLKQVEMVDKRALPVLFVAFYLRLLSHLGYHPSLAYCAGCNKGMPESDQAVVFGLDRGGVVCGACQKPGDYYIGMSAEGYRILKSLQTASLAEAAAVPLGFKDATQLLEVLTKFAGSQTGLKSELKSLEFIEKLKNSQLTG